MGKGRVDQYEDWMQPLSPEDDQFFSLAQPLEVRIEWMIYLRANQRARRDYYSRTQGML